MSQVGLQRSDRLEVLWCSRVSVRNACVSGQLSRKLSGNLGRGVKSWGLGKLQPDDPRPGISIHARPGNAEVTGVPIITKLEQRTARTRFELRDGPVEFSWQ